MNLRAAQVRIYADADVLGPGKILAGLRNDITYPGDPGAVIHKRQRPPCPSPILTCSTRTGYRRSRPATLPGSTGLPVAHHWDCRYTGSTREKARVLTGFLRIGELATIYGCIHPG
jgi:hypothetical protein